MIVLATYKRSKRQDRDLVNVMCVYETFTIWNHKYRGIEKPRACTYFDCIVSRLIAFGALKVHYNQHKLSSTEYLIGIADVDAAELGNGLRHHSIVKDLVKDDAGLEALFELKLVNKASGSAVIK